MYSTIILFMNLPALKRSRERSANSPRDRANKHTVLDAILVEWFLTLELQFSFVLANMKELLARVAANNTFQNHDQRPVSDSLVAEDEH